MNNNKKKIILFTLMWILIILIPNIIAINMSLFICDSINKSIFMLLIWCGYVVGMCVVIDKFVDFIIDDIESDDEEDD